MKDDLLKELNRKGTIAIIVEGVTLVICLGILYVSFCLLASYGGQL